MKSLIIWLLTAILYAPAVWAEFICSADIAYRWKRNDSDKELEVLWVSIEKRATDQALAKQMIAKHATAEKSKVREECMSRHENFSACVGSKFRAMNETMQKLDFSARKSLEEAITADCKGAIGTCLSVVVTEPNCVEKVEAVASDEKVEEKPEKGKDGKKEKKK